MPDNIYPLDLERLAPVYLALLIGGGQIGLPVVVLSASLCKNVTWHPTIVNFCITWIVYSIIHCLYLYAGAGDSTLCMAQASMVYGATPMYVLGTIIRAVVAGLAIVLHTWTTLQCPQCTIFSRAPRLLYSTLMLGTPYLVFFVFSIGAGVIVMSRPQSVGSNGLYCIIQLHRPALLVPSFCAAIMAIMLALEATIAVQYYRQWKIIKTSFPLVTRSPSCSICFRLGLFCLHSCVTFASAILFLSGEQSEVTYMLPAALPLGAFIVFGSREGVMSLWTIVLRGRKHSSSSTELELPTARVAPVPDPTLTPELPEETPRESVAPV